MDRRKFLERCIPVSVLPFALGGYTLQAYGRGRIIDLIAGSTIETDRVLVLIQMNGGNDGLNTVIPLDQYPALANARSNILIPESSVLKISDSVGLHPSMGGMFDLYKAGKCCIVQGVSYPNPNLSHFRGTDIWLTASDSDQILNSGWLGRYLDQEYPDYPNGYPSTVAPDPPAIQIGSVVSIGLQGPAVSMGMAITSPTSFSQLLTGGVDTAPNTPAGHELTFVRQVTQQTEQYSQSIIAASGNATNLSSLYPSPGQNSLADQLKIVAQLIAGGLKTRIYVVNIGGFDTHSDQIDQTDGATVGDHATLLGKLSSAIFAFQDDLKLLKIDHRVVGMTFSEFGRRIKSNASFGTDHGTSAPLFLFGKKVKFGIVGSNPVIPLNPAPSENLLTQYDFRSVYGSVLKNWLGVSQAELDATLLKPFQTLPVIRTQEVWHGHYASSAPGETIPAKAALIRNYPNPFNPLTRIRFAATGGPVEIKVYDTIGRLVKTLMDGEIAPGYHEIEFDARELPSGTYFYRLQSGSVQEVRSMVLVR